MKSFQSFGLWFLPEEPENQVAGTLTYSKDDGLKLSLSGVFKGKLNFAGTKYPTIQGIVNDCPYGRHVTLFDSFATSVSFGIPGASLETIHANHAFAGDTYIDSERCNFEGASVYFSTLRNWLNFSGLKFDFDSSSVSCSWTQPQSVRWQIPGAVISTGFDLQTVGGPHGGLITFEETPSLVIEEFGNATADEIHSRYITPISYLMTFASDGHAELNRYKLHLRRIESKATSYLDRLYSPGDKHASDGIKSTRDMLFVLGDIANDSPSFLEDWFRFAATHQDFCALYFAYGYQRRGYLESRFLFLMFAVENFIREETQDSELVRSFQEFRDSILTSESIQGRPTRLAVPIAHQLAMPTLFLTLIENHWHLLEKLVGTSMQEFTESVFATREFVINRGQPATGVARGANLLWLLQRLGAVLKVCVLKSLQLSDTRINAIIEANPEMGHLRSIKAPWETS